MDVGAVDSGDGDGAERAFEALREEVGGLRRGIEQVSRQRSAAAAGVAAVDYSSTLGAMQKALGVIAGRLEAVERQPALQVTGASLGAELNAAARGASQTLSGSVSGVVSEMRNATQILSELVGRIHEQREQRRGMWAAGAGGVLGGVLLWFFLAALLPWGGGDWLASLPITRGGPWAAGQALLARSSPESWDQMLRLYKACGDQPTQLCEAAITVRAISAGHEETKGSPVIPLSRPSSRSRTSQQVQ